MAYPITKDNIQCISQCQEPKTIITHPITQQRVTNTKLPFCAVTPYKKDGKDIIIGECDLTTEQITSEIVEHRDQFIRTNVSADNLYPLFVFNDTLFLKDYYHIVNLPDFYQWLIDNRNVPVFTKLRVIDCCLRVFGAKISIIENILAVTVIDIIKNFWIKKMYGKLCKYIDVNIDDNKVLFRTTNIAKLDNAQLRSKFIVTNLITQTNIFEILNLYIKEIHERAFVGTNDFLAFMINELLKKIERKIKLN